LGTTVRPNGHTVKLASLKAWIPNGIVTISTHITTPAMTYAMPSHRPARRNQRMLPRVRMSTSARGTAAA
jgi:hypothetical protein